MNLELLELAKTVVAHIQVMRSKELISSCAWGKHYFPHACSCARLGELPFPVIILELPRYQHVHTKWNDSVCGFHYMYNWWIKPLNTPLHICMCLSASIHLRRSMNTIVPVHECCEQVLSNRFWTNKNFSVSIIKTKMFCVENASFHYKKGKHQNWFTGKKAAH